MSETRMPTQKRSIEKRNKIIEKGFELICEKGYYNISTPEIAKYAGVSTGIIYQYFKDKREIFIEGIKNYSNSIMYPLINILTDTKIESTNLESLLKSMIEKFIGTHTMSKQAHEELIAMSHLDNEISQILKNSEMEMTKKIVLLLENNNIHLKNATEKIHIVCGIMDNFCHEIVYHKHSEINYEIMEQEVINIIVDLLS